METRQSSLFINKPKCGLPAQGIRLRGVSSSSPATNTSSLQCRHPAPLLLSIQIAYPWLLALLGISCPGAYCTWNWTDEVQSLQKWNGAWVFVVNKISDFWGCAGTALWCLYTSVFIQRASNSGGRNVDACPWDSKQLGQAVRQHIKQTLEKTTRIIIKLNYKVFILLEQWNQECRQILGELAVVGIWSEISWKPRLLLTSERKILLSFITQGAPSIPLLQPLPTEHKINSSIKKKKLTEKVRWNKAPEWKLSTTRII